MNPAPEPLHAPASGRAPLSDAAVLSKAVVRAAQLLDLTQRDVSAALGISEATASRFSPASTCSRPTAPRSGSSRGCSCACSARSTRCGGTTRRARTWLDERQPRAGGAPQGSVALGRRHGPCRHVPGRRARSPLRPRRCGTTSGAPWRRSTSCRRGAGRHARRAACAGAHARRRQAAGSRRRRASALPAVHAVSLRAAAGRLALSRTQRPGRVLRAPTRCAPRARNSATGAGGICSTRRH